VVASVQIYDRVEAMEYGDANRLALVMLVFVFAVLGNLRYGQHRSQRRQRRGDRRDEWVSVDQAIELPGCAPRTMNGWSCSGNMNRIDPLPTVPGSSACDCISYRRSLQRRSSGVAGQRSRPDVTCN
jgi:hypothetical protein